MHSSLPKSASAAVNMNLKTLPSILTYSMIRIYCIELLGSMPLLLSLMNYIGGFNNVLLHLGSCMLKIFHALSHYFWNTRPPVIWPLLLHIGSSMPKMFTYNASEISHSLSSHLCLIHPSNHALSNEPLPSMSTFMGRLLLLWASRSEGALSSTDTIVCV